MMYRVAMLLLTTRLSAAFMPAAQSAGRRAFSLAASDSDFDGFTSKVRFEFRVEHTVHAHVYVT